MPLINRSERSRANEADETPGDADSGGRRRRLLLVSGLVGAAAGVVALRRRRRPEREFVDIELDGETAEQ